MKKYISVFAVFVLVFCSCETELSEAQVKPNGLLNAIDYGIESNIELDNIIKEGENSNNTTTVYIEYPSKYPAEHLPDSIPLYNGKGYMYMVIYTAPTLSVSDPKKTEVISLSIYEYNPDDVDIYIKELIVNGFSEDIEFNDDVIYALENNMIDSFVKYTTSEHTMQIITNHDERGDFLQLTAIMHDRIK